MVSEKLQREMPLPGGGGRGGGGRGKVKQIFALFVVSFFFSWSQHVNFENKI